MTGRETDKKLTVAVTSGQAAELNVAADFLGTTTTEAIRRMCNLGTFLIEFYRQHPEAEEITIEDKERVYFVPTKAILGINPAKD